LAQKTPNSITKKQGRTHDHLNRQLGDEVGITVGQALKKMRMERSGKLLRETDASIGEIGSAIGFDHQNYFARWFRKETGQSPTRWREARRKA
jgi:AraC family L-rhamnose operon transcriptional activator RhaR